MIIRTSMSLGANENWDVGIAALTMLLDDEPSLLQTSMALDVNDLFDLFDVFIPNDFEAMLHGRWWKNTDICQ